MSRILQKLNLRNDEEIIWTICFFTSLCIFAITISTFVRILQHLHCIPKSNFHQQIEPKHVTVYSSLSATFATLTVIINLSAYPICAQWSCWDTRLDWMYGLLYWNTYITAKLLLYIIFIGRLFNPFYRQIYRYTSCIQHVLWMTLIVLMLTVIVINVAYCLLLVGLQPPVLIDFVCTVIFGVTDCIIAIGLMLLFFRPLCCRRNGNSISPNVYMSVARKYCIISAVQLVAAISFQIALLVWMYLEMMNISQTMRIAYAHIIRLLEMLDCLLLMICIYIGFARRRTVCIPIFPNLQTFHEDMIRYIMLSKNRFAKFVIDGALRLTMNTMNISILVY